MGIFVKPRFRVPAAWAVVAAVLIGSLAWGISASLSRVKYRRMLEGMFEKSFYELVGGVGGIEVSLSKLAVSDQPEMTADLLRDVSRHAEKTCAALSGLPVSQAQTAAVAKLINQVGDWSYAAIGRISDGTPLSASERQTMEELRKRVAGIGGELAALSPGRDALWDIDRTGYFADIAENASPLENVERIGQDYPSLIYDGPFSDGKVGVKPRSLSGPEITQDEAIAIARAFYGEERVSEARASGGAGGALPSFGVELVTEEGVIALAQVTKTGGRVHWLMRDPAEGEEILDTQACMEAGKAFLESRGYGAMLATYAQRYDGLCTINYAAVEPMNGIDNGVLLYPDLVKVQVSMRDGSVVGIEATNYLMNHAQRDLPEPLINAQQARLLAGNNLNIDRVQLCVMPTDGGGELLAWEFAGLCDGERYLVYIDALGGQERRIMKVVDVEGGELTI